MHNSIRNTIAASIFLIISTTYSLCSAQNTEKKLSIEPELLGSAGSIDSEFTGTSDKHIVFIKDAHCNLNAQQNSIRLIQTLIDQYGFSLVCMEGSASALSIPALKEYPMKDMLQNVAYYYFKNSHINGAEYLSITKPNEVFVEGIETKKLYANNYYAFYKSMSFRDKAIEKLSLITEFLDKVKPHYYSEMLMKIDREYNSYITGNSSFIDFIAFLISVCPDRNKLENYPALYEYQQASALRTMFSSTQAETEQTEVLDIIMQYADDQDKAELIRYTFQTTSSPVFASFIKRTADKYLIELDEYPNLTNCMKYIERIHAINETSLLDELDTFVLEIKQSYYVNEKEQEIDQLSNNCALLREACTLSLASYKASTISTIKNSCNPENIIGLCQALARDTQTVLPFTLADMDFIATTLNFVVEFYTLAEQRNNAMFTNTLNKLEKYGTDRCIIYAGGFHAQGICEELRRNNISYTLISPGIAQFDDESGYISRLTDSKNIFQYYLQSTTPGMLAVASKLVEPADALIDPTGTQAFLDQIKTVLTTAGLRSALYDTDRTAYESLSVLDDNQLALISDRIQTILRWKNTYFEDLANLMLRKNYMSGYDLQFDLKGECFFINNIISPQKSDITESQATQHLLSIELPDGPLTITNLPTNSVQISFAGKPFNESAFVTALRPFLVEQVIPEAEFLQDLKYITTHHRELLDFLRKNNFISFDQVKGYTLNPQRASVIRTALRFVADSENWRVTQRMALTDIPESFAELLDKHAISSIELPPDMGIPALLFMLESLPSQFSQSARFPFNESASYIFEKQPVLGGAQFKLSVRIENIGEIARIEKERALLLGSQYEEIIHRQLFGPLPSTTASMLISETATHQFFSAGETENASLLVWANPENAAVFWNEINHSSLHFDPDTFAATGGLLFGQQVGGSYVVSDIVPLPSSSYIQGDDASFTINPASIKQLANLYATGSTVLLGVYRNMSPLVMNQNNTVERSARTDYDVLNSLDIPVANLPLELVFSSKTQPVVDSQSGLISVASMPSDIQVGVYAVSEGTPKLLHSMPALSVVNPGYDMFSATTRPLFLQKRSIETTEKDIVTFRRLPQNNGFTLLTHAILTDQDLSFLVQFFRYFQKQIEMHTTVKEIRIKSGLAKAAHTNRQDDVIEFDIDVLDYPLIVRYLAFPHEWNHSQINIDAAVEEILIIMYDIERIAELAIKDPSNANNFLNELKAYEQPYDGRQLFSETIEAVIAMVREKNEVPDRSAILGFTRTFIESDPALYKTAGPALTTKTDDFFITQFELNKDKIMNDLPAYLPGEHDYALFDEEQITSAQGLKGSKIMDLMKLNVRYLQDQAFHLATRTITPEAFFDDPVGYFNPRQKEIGINVEHPFHRNADGSVNPNTVLATLIKQRTHALLYDNPALVKQVVDRMSEDQPVRDEILKFFFLFTSGQLPRTITPDLMAQLSENPLFARDGEIDYYRVARETIASANGYNSIIHLVNKFKDLKKKFASEGTPLPEDINQRIQQLSDFTFKPTHLLLFKYAGIAEKYISNLDEGLQPLFHIPNFSILHVVHLEYNDIMDSILADIQFDNSSKPENESKIVVDNEEDKVQLLVKDPLSSTEISSFLSLTKAMKRYTPVETFNAEYSPEIARNNARDFYAFLKKKHVLSTTTALPADIVVLDIFLGSIDYIKDFLDEFKKVDQENLFYNRLRYNVASHSQASRYLLDQALQSNLLTPYNDVIRFQPFTDMDELLALAQKALLVRSFGDMSLLGDTTLIEKRGQEYYEIYGQAVARNSSQPQYVLDAVAQLMLAPNALLVPEFQALPESVLDEIDWIEKPVSVDVESLPFGLFLQSYTENVMSGRFIYHPSLLKLAQRTLSSMSLKFGGYWQLFGNSFEAMEPQLQNSDIHLTELDSIFLANIIQNKGNFQFETQHQYLDKTGQQKPIYPLIEILKELDPERISRMIPYITISDLQNAPKIYALRSDPSYNSSDEFTFNRFLRDLKQKGYIPKDLSVNYVKTTDDRDSFIVNIDRGLRGYFPTDTLARVLTDHASAPSVSTEDDLIELLREDPLLDSTFVSDQYLRSILKSILALAERTNFHLRIDTIPPQQTVSDAPELAITELGTEEDVKIIKLNQQEFDDYIKEITSKNPYLDYGDPRGLANPLTGEIIVNIDHPDHYDESGNISIAAVRQTIIHEKTHMLIFKKWSTLQNVVKEAIKYETNTDLILKLFFEFYFGEKVTVVNQDHKRRLRRDPLWNDNGVISYERILSELLSLINQYQMLPYLLRQLSKLQMEFTQEGKVVPAYIITAQKHITQIFHHKRELISRAVAARTELTKMDPRVGKDLIFHAQEFEQPIKLTEIELKSLPLPSAPIKTVYSDDEIIEILNQTWLRLGDGSVDRGKKMTSLTPLQKSDIEAALNELESKASAMPSASSQINAVVEFWKNILVSESIFIFPHSPERYSITGTHFIYAPTQNEIIIAEGYYNYIKNAHDLAKLLLHSGLELTGKDTALTTITFDGISISDKNKELYEHYLYNLNYLPVIEEILALYGIKLDDLTQPALYKIIAQHKAVFELPGIQKHIQTIRDLIAKNTDFQYHSSPITKAFEVYAESSLTPDEVNQIQNAVMNISAIALRDLSAPVVVLIDHAVFDGPVGPQNFAVRESLDRFRREMELLEKRNVVIIAVDMNNKPAGEIRENINSKLKRKGANSNDFDYVVSLSSHEDLINALRSEYPSLPEHTLRANIKVLAESGSSLYDFAHSYDLSVRSTDTHTLANDEGTFLIDYLRSLGLTHFMTGGQTNDTTDQIRQSMYVVSIRQGIDENTIPEAFRELFALFIKFLEQVPESLPADTILEQFYKTVDISVSDWQFIMPLLEEEITLYQLNKVFSELQNTASKEINSLQSLYLLLVKSFEESESKLHSDIIDTFYKGLTTADRVFFKGQFNVAKQLQADKKLENIITSEELFGLFTKYLIDMNKVSADSLYILERQIKSDSSAKLVAFDAVMKAATNAGIAITPGLERYLQIEIAPRTIEPDLQKVISLQKLFDESA
jgi:hypothetical protein